MSNETKDYLVAYVYQLEGGKSGIGQALTTAAHPLTRSVIIELQDMLMQKANGDDFKNGPKMTMLLITNTVPLEQEEPAYE